MCAGAATRLMLFNVTLRGALFKLISKRQPPWPNGQGVGLLIRRLWVRVPQGVFFRLTPAMTMKILKLRCERNTTTIAEPGFDPGTFGL